MDNLNNEQNVILTPEDKEKVIQALKDEIGQNDNLKILRDLPSNNGVEEHEPEEGKEVKTMVSVNPYTGEKTPVPSDKELEEDKSLEDVFADLGETLNNESEEDSFVDITIDDIKKYHEEEGTSIGKYDITDETALALIQVINKKQRKETVKFKDLPKQIQDYIDQYLLKESGLTGFSPEINSLRNSLTEALLEEYITQIGFNKIDEDFNKEIEALYESAGKEMSPLFKEYNENREEYLRNLTSKIEDEDKKILAEKVLDSIHDAFELKRITSLENKIKLKAYYLEEPEKVYKSEIENKYHDTEYTIYKLSMIQAILDRHLKSNGMIPEDDTETAKKIVLAFALFCRNYSINNPEDHAFMYYYTYNVILLDIYKDENYDDYAKDFLANNMKILDVIKCK